MVYIHTMQFIKHSASISIVKQKLHLLAKKVNEIAPLYFNFFLN